MESLSNSFGWNSIGLLLSLVLFFGSVVLVSYILETYKVTLKQVKSCKSPLFIKLVLVVSIVGTTMFAAIVFFNYFAIKILTS